jgi:hypothetical protein
VSWAVTHPVSSTRASKARRGIGNLLFDIRIT